MESDRNDHAVFDRRDAEIQRLKKECDHLRTRERLANAEAERAQERLSQLSLASRTFASSIRGRVAERERTRRRLAAQYNVGRVLAKAGSLDEAIPEILKTLGEDLGWTAGAFWTVDEDTDVLRCGAFLRPSNASTDELESVCRRTSFRRGSGLPGRVWATQEPAWVEDGLTEVSDLIQDKIAAEEGPRGALAFPIRSGIVFGVVELFDWKVSPPDEDSLLAVGVIGNQIGQFVERRRAEEERERFAREAASERARFEAVLQQMPAGVFIAGLDEEFFLHNEEAERIYGRPINSIKECGRHTYSYPDGGELPPEQYPLNRSLEHGEFVSDEEHCIHRSDGTRGVIRTNAAPVRDEEGRIVAAVKAFEDVTWRKEAETALKESEERMRTIVEGAPVILFALDREGVVTTLIGRGLNALGLEPGESVGASIFDFHVERPEILKHVRRALSGESFTENVRVDGVVFETSYSPLRDAEGEVAGVIGVAHDVTERQKVQEERERYLARERTARAQSEERRRISRELHDRVAHSMAVVHQSLELYEVLEERSPEAARTKMELARSMAKEALDSTRNLSSELRRPEIQRSLEAALADLLRDVVPSEVSSHLSVEGDEATIPSDMRDQLFLVLREAVRNATKHSGCGRLAVELSVTPERIVGSVEDDGRGFAPEEINGRSRSNGLRSMEERASLVGGSLGVSSAPGEGTKVKLSVPLKEEA